MRPLTIEEKKYFEKLITYSARIYNGYYKFQPNNKKYGIKKYKRSRVLMMLNLGMWLNPYELVHHKDGNKLNDSISNLEVLNTSEHSNKHHTECGKKPKNWKPANATTKDVQNRIKQIASEMVKINCSEISRRLKREGINKCDQTIKKYV